jgi:hypothetical protein
MDPGGCARRRENFGVFDTGLVGVIECLADAVIVECFGGAIGGSSYYGTSCGARDDFGAEVVDRHAVPSE